MGRKGQRSAEEILRRSERHEQRRAADRRPRAQRDREERAIEGAQGQDAVVAVENREQRARVERAIASAQDQDAVVAAENASAHQPGPLDSSLQFAEELFGRTLEDAFYSVHGRPLPPPFAVTPLSLASPTVFVLTSSNCHAQEHFNSCVQRFLALGMQPVPVFCWDPEKFPDSGVPIYIRARLAWTLFGVPQICRALRNSGLSMEEWVVVAEDSCKPFAHVSLDNFRAVAGGIQTDAIWAGYRRLLEAAATPRVLCLR